MRFIFLITVLLLTFCAQAIERQKIISNADTFAKVQWTVKSGNADSYWNSRTVGKKVTGMAYNWGGFNSVSEFLSRVNAGRVAGNDKKTLHDSEHVRTDFAGIDCSGFVSRVWETSSKYSTSTLPNISKQINWSDLKTGDILNKAGSHVRLFHYYNSDGSMMVYESTTSAGINGVTQRVLSRDNSYVPRRFNQVKESTLKPTPVISSVYPNPLPTKPAGERQWLILIGENFSESNKLNFKMVGYAEFNDRQPLFMDAQTLAYEINVGTTPATWEVQVVTAEKQASNRVSFQVKKP
jgi:hypothetical protein